MLVAVSLQDRLQEAEENQEIIQRWKRAPGYKQALTVLEHIITGTIRKFKCFVSSKSCNNRTIMLQKTCLLNQERVINDIHEGACSFSL